MALFMSNRGDPEFLKDIQEAICRIHDYLGSMEYAEFLNDKKTQDAITRNLEIIGEATKRLSESLRLKNPQLPWKNMSGLRDRLIHHYFGINIDIVWQVVAVDLPKIFPELDQIVQRLDLCD